MQYQSLCIPAKLSDKISKELGKRDVTSSSLRDVIETASATVEDISAWKDLAKSNRDEQEWPLISTSLKVDKQVKMGLVTDIKQELRQIGALKVVYSTSQGRD